MQTIPIGSSRARAVALVAVMVVATFGVGTVAAAPRGAVGDLAASPQNVIVGFVGLPDAALVRAHGGTVTHEYRIVTAVAATVPSQAVDALARNPNVAYVSPDLTVHAIGETTPWGVTKVGADQVQTGGNDGSGVDVYVLDTGVDYGHPDLAHAYVDGYDFAYDDADPMDGDGHGTHVSGTIAAAAGNDRGVVGVAPGVDLYAGKVLDDTGSGSFSDVIAGIDWAVYGPDGVRGSDDDAEIISMSLGASSGTTALKNAVDAAAASGVLVVASAGNSGNPPGKGDNVGYPAAYASVVAVAATDQNDERASFSSTGPAVELAAPGVGVYSTVPGGYASYSGTSMAAPHVSGVAALVLASAVVGEYDADGDGVWDASEVRARLADTSVDLGPNGRDERYGHGRVDAVAAVGGSGGSGSTDAAPGVSLVEPADGATLAGTVWVNATASDAEDAPVDLTVTYRVDDGSETAMTYDSATDRFSAEWDTSLVGDGDHTVTVTAVDSAGGTATDDVTVTTENVDDAPTVSVTTPATGVSVGGVVFVNATATDDRTDTASLTVTYAVDGGAATPMTYDSATDRFYAEWDTSLVADGDHTVTVTASDGTTSATDSVTVTVANTVIGPVVESMSATEVSGPNPHSTVQVDWTVSDGNGDLNRLTVVVVGSDGSAATYTEPLSGGSDVGSVSFDFKFADGETYDVSLTVWDDTDETDVATDTA